MRRYHEVACIHFSSLRTHYLAVIIKFYSRSVLYRHFVNSTCVHHGWQKVNRSVRDLVAGIVTNYTRLKSQVFICFLYCSIFRLSNHFFDRYISLLSRHRLRFLLLYGFLIFFSFFIIFFSALFSQLSLFLSSLSLVFFLFF